MSPCALPALGASDSQSFLRLWLSLTTTAAGLSRVLPE
jgi:hypothetical protein